MRLELLKRGIPHDGDGVAGDARLDEHFGRAHGPANPGRRSHALNTRAVSTSFKTQMFDLFKPPRHTSVHTRSGLTLEVLPAPLLARTRAHPARCQRSATARLGRREAAKARGAAVASGGAAL